MRSCGGARGSKPTTNIITVWAVEEVGERAGGERSGVYATQAYNCFLCVCFMEVHTEKAVYPSCLSAWLHWLNLPPLSVSIVGVSASIWDMVKRKDAAVPPLLCTFPTGPFFSATHAPYEFMVPLASRAQGQTFLSTTIQTCQQHCARSGNLSAVILSRLLSRFMKLVSALGFSYWTHWFRVCATNRWQTDCPSKDTAASCISSANDVT